MAFADERCMTVQTVEGWGDSCVAAKRVLEARRFTSGVAVVVSRSSSVRVGHYGRNEGRVSLDQRTLISLLRFLLIRKRLERSLRSVP